MEDKELFRKHIEEVVEKFMSNESKNKDDFIARIEQLSILGCDITRLLTGALGLSAESGEFTEIVKKIAFQGKPYTHENRFHMKRELGDIFWYWLVCAKALDIDPIEIISENRHKLESRYPTGGFTASHSENRKKNDL